MTPLSDRPRYAPRAPVDWQLLPVLVAVPAVAALALGWVLRTLFVHDWYLIIYAPIVAGAVLGGVVALIVRLTRCRSRWLGCSVGVLSGLLLYLSYYHFCLINQLPAGSVHRVDLLPPYIWKRLRTDVVVEVCHHPPVFRVGEKLAPRGQDPAFLMNVWTICFELPICCWIATVAAWKLSGRAFCEDPGQWMKRGLAILSPYFTPHFVNALEAGRLAAFAAVPPAGYPMTGGRLVLEYVSHASEPALSFPVYVSTEDYDPSRRFPPLRRVRRTMVRQVELEPSEVIELRPLFPELARLLEEQHPRLREQSVDALTSPDPVSPAGDIVRITPVPEPYRQRVRSPGYALSVNLLGAIPIAFLFGGLGVAGAGGWLIDQGQILPGSLLAAAGVSGIAWGIYTALLCTGVYAGRWIHRRLCEEIARRPDVLVHPDDPDALNVSIIPRDSFAIVKWTISSDILLLKIDRPHRQILMEGDSDRYRIPAGAVIFCEPQMFFHPMDAQQHTEIWTVLLLVSTEQGVRELLISAGRTGFAPRTNKGRRRRAEDLCRQVRELAGAAA